MQQTHLVQKSIEKVTNNSARYGGRCFFAIYILHILWYNKPSHNLEIGGAELLTYYIPIIMMLVILFIVLRRSKHAVVKKLIKKRRTEGTNQMIELAKKFIEKECLVYAFDGHQFEGTIKEVSNGALLIEKKGAIEAINLDFVIRIREYPKDKKGKKKSVVLD